MGDLGAASAVALAGACAAALLAAPGSVPGGSLVATLLLFLPSLAIAFIVQRSMVRVRRRELEHSPLAWLLAASSARAVVVAGAWLVNRFVVDAPGGPHAWAGYSLVLAVCIGAATYTLRRVRSDALSGRAALGVFVWTSGVELGLVDAYCLPHEHAAIHDALLLSTVVCLVAGTALFAVSVRQQRLTAVAGLAMLVLFSASAWQRGFDRTALMSHYTAHQRLLLAASELMSPPPAPSLTESGMAPVPHAVDVVAVDAPRVVLLITVDTFRCGFGVAPYADLCPRLTELGAEGRLRVDGHANFPLTARAMTSLHTGDLFANPARAVEHPFHLASFFAHHGYRTHAVITHAYVVADRGVRTSFDTVDDSLIAAAAQPAGVTSDAVTDRLIAAVAVGGSAFVWGHYFDPHAPYVDHQGQVLVWSETDAYAAEMRRTDAAIGRLIDSLAGRDDVMIFVTADHGEEFGEHGARNHGYALHEEVMRVPMLAWSSGANHRRYGGAVLPDTTVAVAPYLTEVVTHEAPPWGGPIFLRTPIAEDPQIAVIDEGWKLIEHTRLGFVELYHLDRDPAEHWEVSRERPDRVARLGASIHAFRKDLEQHRTRDLLNLAGR